VGGQHHTPATLPPGNTRYPLYRRLGGPQGRSGRVQKISPPPGFDPRTVQPVASRYTDWATEIYISLNGPHSHLFISPHWLCVHFYSVSVHVQHFISISCYKFDRGVTYHSVPSCTQGVCMWNRVQSLGWNIFPNNLYPFHSGLGTDPTHPLLSNLNTRAEKYNYCS
jgi:hypothetical protein